MGFFTRFSLAVRRRETPFYDRIYRIAKAIFSISMPCIPGVHRFLYGEWSLRTRLWHEFWRVVYYEPMFKARCKKVGKGFRLEYSGNGICRVLGNLNIYIGDNVYTFDNIGLSATRVYDNPELHIGSNTYLGPSTIFNIAKEVRIGSHTIIGSNIFFTDNPGHPQNPVHRLTHGGGLPEKTRIKEVFVGDHCFLGRECLLYPGTKIGDGTVIRARSTISGTIPPFAIAGGSPCKVSRLMYIPEEMRKLAGEEKYQAWIAEQEAYMEKHPETKRSHYDA